MKSLLFVTVLVMANLSHAAMAFRVKELKEPKSVQHFQSKFNDDFGTIDEGLDFASDGAICFNGRCDRATPGYGSGPSPVIKSPKRQDTVTRIRSRMDVYSNSNHVKKLIDEAVANLKTQTYIETVTIDGKPKKVTYCYRAVKDALRDAGWVTRSFQGSGVARDAANDLLERRYGFIDLLKDKFVGHLIGQDASLAPKGTIIVYDTNEKAPAKISRAGHVEIKTTDSGIHGYVSISQSTKPTYGYAVPQQRRIIAVLYKNLVKAK